MDELGAERTLRERADDLVERVADADRAALVEEFNEFGAAVVAAAGEGEVPRPVALGLLRDVEDALLVRGVDWIDPALPDLPDVTGMAAASTAEAEPMVPAASVVAHPPAPPTPSPPLPAAHGPLRTAGGVHVISWRDGSLILDAHPDPDADEALAALGGERCPCLDVRAAWTAQRADPAILLVGARSPTERVSLAHSAVEAARDAVSVWRNRARSLQRDLAAAGDPAAAAGVAEVVGRAEPHVARRLGFLALLTLPPALVARLQADAVAWSMAASGPAAEEGEGAEVGEDARRARLRVDLALRSRIRRTLADARRPAGPLPALQPAWLVDVWARGVGTVDGRFVTGVHPGDASALVAEFAGGGKAELAFGVDGWETEARSEP